MENVEMLQIEIEQYMGCLGQLVNQLLYRKSIIAKSQIKGEVVQLKKQYDKILQQFKQMRQDHCHGQRVIYLQHEAEIYRSNINFLTPVAKKLGKKYQYFQQKYQSEQIELNRLRQEFRQLQTDNYQLQKLQNKPKKVSPFQPFRSFGRIRIKSTERFAKGNKTFDQYKKKLNQTRSQIKFNLQIKCNLIQKQRDIEQFFNECIKSYEQNLQKRTRNYKLKELLQGKQIKSYQKIQSNLLSKAFSNENSIEILKRQVFPILTSAQKPSRVFYLKRSNNKLNKSVM